jgi:anti-sigma regulatory factor (Ser/Thr protein kinase)
VPKTVTQGFSRDDSSVPQARTFVHRTLSEWHIRDRADDVLLCVSELATNAIRHGTSAGGRYLVKVSADDEHLRVEVHDLSRRRPRVQNPGESDANGRGLLLVNALADEWGVEPCVPRGKVVWTEFKIETPRQHAAAQVGQC